MNEPSLKKKNVLNRILSNQLMITIVTTCSMLFVLVGASYAILNDNGDTSNVDVTVNVGNMQAVLNTSEEYTFDSTYQNPVSDTVGLSQDGYSFSLTNSGSIPIEYYEIRLVDQENKQTTLAHKFIRYVVQKAEEGYSVAKNLGDSNSIIYAGTDLAIGDTINFTLKMWIDANSGSDAWNKKLYGGLEVTLYQRNNLEENYVVYDANGGSNAPSKTSINEKITLDVPVHETLEFLGWSRKANGSVDFESGAVYSGVEGMTLYAVWGTSAAKTIKEKLGTDGLVAVNTIGELYEEGDTIREYRYSGNGKYCTYTSGGQTYTLNVEGDTCPNACMAGSGLFNDNNEVYISYKQLLGSTVTCSGLGGTQLTPNESEPNEGDVKNYVSFNGELWRIIGVFNEKNANGVLTERLKIIRDVPLANDLYPDLNYTYNGSSYLLKNEQTVDEYELGYYMFRGSPNLSDWTTAGLQYYLNDKDGVNSYYNTINVNSKQLIETMVYSLGNIGVDPSLTAKTIYFEERSVKNVHDGSVGTWTGKIALMYPSDYGYAAKNNHWNSTLVSDKQVSGALENWMYDNIRMTELTLSPYSGDVLSNVVVGTVGSLGLTNGGAVSPVLYLKSNVVITDGTGTETDPYVLALR